MARVNRTTGFFLVLGVIALLGTVTGISVMQNRGQTPANGPARSNESSIHASGTFDYDTGMSNLVPRVIGRVKAVLAKEGDSVKGGQPLVQLDDTYQRAMMKAAEQAVVVGRAKLYDAKVAVEQKLKEYQLDVKKAEVALVNANAAHESAKEELKAAQKYKGIAAYSEEMESRAQRAVSHASDTVRIATEILNMVKAMNPKVSLTEHEEALKEAELKLSAAKEELESFVIRAPSDGKVGRINYQVAGPAPLPMADPNSGQALIFSPNDAMIVRAEIDQEWALMVKAGMKVTVTFAAGNGEFTWTGVVDRLADTMQRRRSGVMNPAVFSDGITRECVIRVTPDSRYEMVHNMHVQVKIRLEK